MIPRRRFQYANGITTDSINSTEKLYTTELVFRRADQNKLSSVTIHVTLYENSSFKIVSNRKVTFFLASNS